MYMRRKNINWRLSRVQPLFDRRTAPIIKLDSARDLTVQSNYVT